MLPRKLVALAAVACLCCALTACSSSSKLAGTYHNQNGLATLQIKSDGTASLTAMGNTTACTYKVSGSQLALNCKDGNFTFLINDDGTLTSQGTFIGVMTKAKT